MQVITNIAQMQQLSKNWRDQGETISLVTTMGNLHGGHLALIHQAKQLSTRCIVSIYVNPLQFAPNEDFNSYPRTYDSDLEQLHNVPVDVVFMPSDSAIYPNGQAQHTIATVPSLSHIHCGQVRTQFFAGVTTIVLKLFNITAPHLAMFGKKDYQQLQCIKAMVTDLCLPIAIHGIETVREDDGLAVSSRNQYLSASQRTNASQFYRTLVNIKQQIQSGQRNYLELACRARQQLDACGFTTEYINICRANDLSLATASDQQLITLAATTLGTTRLIDNIACNLGNAHNS